MEKIMNLQMPGSMPVSTQARPVQSSDPQDGFLKLLQQKQETSGPDPKKDEPTDSVKDKAPDTKEEPKEMPAEDEEPTEGMQQLAQELAAQQAAVQQTVVTPDWQEQPAAVETVVEAAVEVLPAELPAETERPVMTEQADVQAPEKAELSMKPAEDLTAQQVVPETKPEDGRQEASLSGQTSGRTEEIQTPKETAPKEVSGPVREENRENTEETPKAVYGQHTQSQALGRTETFGESKAAEGTVMKATVEEFPEELGKALASGQASNGQTLTVELEPVSLGKLTIRVEYEAGRAAVSIMASNPKTLEILSEKASEIASILKEHTGEETVIYTQEAQQQQEQDQYDGHQGGSRSDQKEQRQQKGEDRHEAESFAQQLRLGLV